MDKLAMAHDWYMKHADGANTHMDLEIGLAWKYADAMQAEADKRVKSQEEVDAEQSKMVRETLQNSGKEWQPDWSVSPDWANYWSIEFGGYRGRWYSEEPKKSVLYYQGRVNSLEQDSPNFGYRGLWQESLRKRPE